LLKTLEEPPEHIVFMMATTQPEDIPQTIRSRCQHFSFHAVKFDDILAQLRDIAAREEISAEDAALAQLAEAGDGSMRDALSIMDQAIASAPLENGRPHLDAGQVRELMGTVPNAVFERLMEAISQGQTAVMIEQVNTLLNAGNSASQLARQFVHYLRNTLMARIDGENSELLQISPDERARAARSAALFSEEDLTRFLQIMLRTFDDLNYRQEQRFHLELGLVKLVHLGRLLPVEELLSKFPTSSSASQPPRARSAETRTATSTPRPSEPPKPAFSPFEADRNRKITGEVSAVPASSTTAPAPRPLMPVEITARAAEAAPVKLPSAPVSEPSTEATAGALALAAEPAIAPNPPAEISLDRIRDAVTAALDAAGHNTAAVLVANGKWAETAKGIEVEVALRKTMRSLTMNAEAEKISREALRSIGVSQKLVFLPGEGASGPAANAAPARPSGGSIQAAALDHPLVKQAQELFQAEVRSVLDLRDKK